MNKNAKRILIIKEYCTDDEVLQLFKVLIELSANYVIGDQRLTLIDLLLDELVEREFHKK